MEKIKGVVFDLDGTLVDTVRDIARSVNHVLALHDRPTFSLEEYKTMVGWGLRQLLQTATASRPFSDAEFETVYQQLLVEYRSKPVVHSVLYEGIEPLLRSIPAHVKTAVLSNKEHGMTVSVVTQLMPFAEFDIVLGARPGIPHKPDPTALLQVLNDWNLEPEEVAYLGDSNVDMETSNAAGTVSCGACWGFRGKTELVESGARWTFESPDEFRRWILEALSRPAL